MSLYSPGRRRAILVLLLSSVLLITLDLRGNALLDSARSAWIQALRPFESAAEVVARPIRNAWRGITDYDDLEAENERLREQADAQLSNDIKARTVLAENARLRAMQNLESLGDYDRVTSSVIGPSPSNLDQIIEIDSGRDKGVRVGMPVVTSAGFLVGKIHRVFANTAYVLLITDTNYFLNVRIERPADELPEPQFITSTTTTSTTTTTTTIAVDSLAPGAGVATVTTAPSTTSTSTSTTTTTTTTPAAAAGGAVTTSSLVTTTTMVSDPIPRDRAAERTGSGRLAAGVAHRRHAGLRHTRGR